MIIKYNSKIYPKRRNPKRQEEKEEQTSIGERDLNRVVMGLNCLFAAANGTRNH